MSTPTPSEVTADEHACPPKARARQQPVPLGHPERRAVTPVTPQVIPQMNTLVEAKDALCAGETQFVYTTDGVGGITWSYTRAKFSLSECDDISADGTLCVTPPYRPWLATWKEEDTEWESGAYTQEGDTYVQFVIEKVRSHCGGAGGKGTGLQGRGKGESEGKEPPSAPRRPISQVDELRRASLQITRNRRASRRSERRRLGRSRCSGGRRG